MSRPPPLEPLARKTISIPVSLWEEVMEYRHNERIGTEAEALRRLIQSGLRAETRKRGLK
jgi:hypothetical protein